MLLLVRASHGCIIQKLLKLGLEPLVLGLQLNKQETMNADFEAISSAASTGVHSFGQIDNKLALHLLILLVTVAELK